MAVKIIVALFAVAICVGLVQCAPRTQARASGSARAHNNHTHIPIEHASIKFYYDPTFHTFVTVTKTTCFMAPLTHDEQDHVHSSLGMEDLEKVTNKGRILDFSKRLDMLRAMREWIGQLPETKIYHDDQTLPPMVKQWCANMDIYLLERGLTTQPMSTM